MNYNRKYIKQLIKKNRIGMVIKLLKDNKNIWSVDNFNTSLSTQHFHLVYYMDVFFNRNDVNGNWNLNRKKAGRYTECDNINYLSHMKYVFKKFNLKIQEVNPLFFDIAVLYILTNIKLAPDVAPFHLITDAPIIETMDEFVNLNYGFDSETLHRCIRTIIRNQHNGYTIVNKIHLLKHFTSDFIICRYPTIHEYTNTMHAMIDKYNRCGRGLIKALRNKS
jgi:hypothetical protein